MLPELRPGKNEHIASRRRLTGFVSLFFSYAFCMAAVFFAVLPGRGTVEAGKASPQTFRAPYAVEDEAATSDLRAKASVAVKKVYETDYDAASAAQDRLEAYLSAIDRMKTDAATLREKVAKDNKTAAKRGDLTAAEWREVIGKSEIGALRSTESEGITDDEVYEILAVPASEMRVWIREALARVSKAVRAGIREEDLSKAKMNAVSALTPYTPAGIVSLNAKIADQFVVTTSVYSDSSTQQQRLAAANAVEPVVIDEGAVIVEKGQVIKPAVYSILQKLGYVHTRGETFLKMAALCVVLLGCFLLYALFSRLYLPPADMGSGALQAILLVLCVALGVLTFKLNIHFNPAYLCAALLTLLVSDRSALGISLLASVLLGVIAGGSHGFDFAAIIQTILASALGTLTGILFVRRSIHRFSIISAGLVSGVAMAAVYALFGILRTLPVSEILINVLWGIGSGLAFAVTSIGLLPLWEWLFDVATPARLVELGNVDNTLLKRLMLEAPGTYHHSMMVATLAEAAANAVGANALLARVGAYYHDIGKIRRPYFFKENQRANDNPHDSMEAGASASIIISHVKDGLLYAQKTQLPEAVRRIIAEHHGTTAVTYFYHKAVQATGDPQLPMTGFRYGGPKPTTRESAIVMLADSVEAGVRSLETASRDKVEEMTHKIIAGKINDGQMSSAPLLFADIELISHAMIKAFNGILHERIEYPEINGTGEEQT